MPKPVSVLNIEQCSALLLPTLVFIFTLNDKTVVPSTNLHIGWTVKCQQHFTHFHQPRCIYLGKKQEQERGKIMQSEKERDRERPEGTDGYMGKFSAGDKWEGKNTFILSPEP